MAQMISTSPEVKLDLTGQVQRLGEHYVAIGEHADFWLGEWRRGSTITKVGIKQLRGGSTTKPNFIENLREGLRRHGSVWLELKDDHISRFLGLAFDLGLGPMPALILEYHPNGNILHYAKQHPMSNEDKLHLITQVALGLQYLHERKPPIIHGDIRAANVLINDNGQAVLTDYGLAFIIESSDFTSIKTAGNCRWTAPEIMNPSDDDESVESSPPFTLASDIFAFAMFAVEVFTELPPFAKLKNDSAVIFAIISNKRPELPSCVAEKPALSDLLKRCWHQEPTQRPSAREVCDILSPYVREQSNIGSWLGSIFSAVRSLWFR